MTGALQALILQRYISLRISWILQNYLEKRKQLAIVLLKKRTQGKRVSVLVGEPPAPAAVCGDRPREHARRAAAAVPRF